MTAEPGWRVFLADVYISPLVERARCSRVPTFETEMDGDPNPVGSSAGYILPQKHPGA